jgi:hypothetical protein
MEVFVKIIRMKENFVSSSITNQKISPFDCSGIEIFEFFLVMLFMGHPVSHMTESYPISPRTCQKDGDIIW